MSRPVLQMPPLMRRAVAIAAKWNRKPKIPKWKIVRGDLVEVRKGSDKGKQGVVARVIRKQNRVIVKGANTRHRFVATGPPDNYTGEVPKKWTRIESPLHISNVMLLDPETSQPTRISEKKLNGKTVRVSKRSGAIIPKPDPASFGFERKTDVNEDTDTLPVHVLARTYVPPTAEYLAHRLERLGLKVD